MSLRVLSFWVYIKNFLNTMKSRVYLYNHPVAGSLKLIGKAFWYSVTLNVERIEDG